METISTIWTTEELDQHIKAYKNALLALSTSQEYMMEGKRLVRADLPEIRKTLDYLSREKTKLLSAMTGPIVINVGIPGRG